MRHISAWQKNVRIEAGRNGNISEDGVDLCSVRTRCVAIRDGRKPECVAINAYLKVTRIGTEALGYSEFLNITTHDLFENIDMYSTSTHWV